MAAMFFIDTNVLLYAASKAAQDQTKRKIARRILAKPGIALSAQVLQEFYAVAISKEHLQMTHDDAVAVLRSLAAFLVCSISRDLVLRATDTKQRFQISYWDATILAAAREMQCSTAFSEDLNDGQDYDGIMIVNPFAATSA